MHRHIDKAGAVARALELSVRRRAGYFVSAGFDACDVRTGSRSWLVLSADEYRRLNVIPACVLCIQGHVREWDRDRREWAIVD